MVEALNANGAKYESQGQALSGAKRVAPGLGRGKPRALKVRNVNGLERLWRSFRAGKLVPTPRGDALRSAQRLPLAFILPRLWR